MNENTTEPYVSKSIGLGAVYGTLGLSSLAYATHAANQVTGDLEKFSAGGMACLPAFVAMGAIAALVSTRSLRQGLVAGAVAVGGIGLQGVNSLAYWESVDSGVSHAKTKLADAEKVNARFEATPSAPIQARLNSMKVEGGPVERRQTRAMKRRLEGDLAEARQSEFKKLSLQNRVEEAAKAVSTAKATAQGNAWMRTVLVTAVETLGVGAMALSAKVKQAPAPQPQPQPAPKPVNPASNLAHMGWSGERGQKRREALRKAKTLNEAAI